MVSTAEVVGILAAATVVVLVLLAVTSRAAGAAEPVVLVPTRLAPAGPSVPPVIPAVDAALGTIGVDPAPAPVAPVDPPVVPPLTDLGAGGAALVPSLLAGLPLPGLARPIPAELAGALTLPSLRIPAIRSGNDVHDSVMATAGHRTVTASAVEAPGATTARPSTTPTAAPTSSPVAPSGTVPVSPASGSTGGSGSPSPLTAVLPTALVLLAAGFGVWLGEHIDVVRTMTFAPSARPG